MKRMAQTTLFLFAFFIFLLLLPKQVNAKWYYPMDKYYQRQKVKGFAKYINDDFYQGKEKLFPYNRFYGYHAAVDLEVNSSEIEKNVPVYAVHSGTITYIGSLPGYGGVILEKLDNENSTALYGHVKIANLPTKVGDSISTQTNPVILTYLGDEFSSETSKERKHLHFGIYKGIDLYFKGHENSKAEIEKKWYDPNEFLEKQNAMDPLLKTIPTAFVNNTRNQSEEKRGLLYFLLSFIKQLIRF